MPLLCSLTKPMFRLRIIACHTVAFVIKNAKIELRRDISMIGGLA